MITYLYWAVVIGLVIAAVLIIGIRLNNPSVAIISALVILATGWSAYHFHFQQLFVKRWGGVMSIRVPSGQHHMLSLIHI